MTIFKKTTLVAALAMAIAAPAHATSVGGVTWNELSPLDFLATTGNFAQTFTGSLATNDLVISGYGRIDFLNGDNQATFCPGCELTFAYTGFTQSVGFAPNTTGGYEFTGGLVQLYVDAPGNFVLGNAATATNGTLWLDLVAHSIFGTGTVEDLATTLIAGFTQAGATGYGLLDVGAGGGLANAYFDTNSRFDGADVEYQNSFPQGLGYQFGSGNFFSQTQVVPEPASLALFGLGVLGLFAARRRKS